MENYNVIFYERDNGQCPVEEFIDSLDVKIRAKVVGYIEILMEKGHLVREPYSKSLGNGIYELRCGFSNNEVRIFYFYDTDKTIVLTNGIVKKTQKTPIKDILIAKKYRYDYIKGKAI